MASYRYERNITEEDLRPVKERHYTRRERWNNWWDYNLKWVIIAAVVIAGAALLIRRDRRGATQTWKPALVLLVALLLLCWLAWFIITGSLKVPLARTGFRMVVFSIIIMVVVLFFRRGIMGDKELSDLLFRKKTSVKEAAK